MDPINILAQGKVKRFFTGSGEKNPDKSVSGAS
jgi:hypothetical protein